MRESLSCHGPLSLLPATRDEQGVNLTVQCNQ